MFADIKDQCGKLPSIGLYVATETGAYKPILVKEVCQGIEYLTVVTTTGHRDTFVSSASFISSAPYNSAGSAYITLAAVTTTGNYSCAKRSNGSGHTWRDTKANDATNFPLDNAAVAAESPAISGGVYKPATTATVVSGSVSKYGLFYA